MQTDDAQARGRENESRQGPGGSVEPAKRAELAKALFQTPDDPVVERYELRDALTDLTYRANSRAEIIAKAEQIGSSRFVAIDTEGRRTPVQKVGTTWQRQQTLPPHPPVPDQAIDDESRAPVPAAAKVVALDAAKPAARDTSAERAVAKIDAEAERTALVARLEAALLERYVIKRAPVTVGELTIGRTEYRFRGDTTRVAFTESTFRLATDTNSPSVARSMVDVAEARGWRALRVSGNEEFKRLVWLEATVRGVKTIGYEPGPADLELVKREREARAVNRIEPARGDAATTSTAAAEKASGRGGGRKAVLAAIEAILVAKRVPQARLEAVMAAASEKLAQRIGRGEQIKVKVYDKAAPSHRPVYMPQPEQQRSRERAAPVR
ncbi:MAG: hypothetical protein JNJ42_08110 [Burkholderiaceae bacterium]|nr:hypothetical protein [Burkholderiaceae bacterium]